MRIAYLILHKKTTLCYRFILILVYFLQVDRIFLKKNYIDRKWTSSIAIVVLFNNTSASKIYLNLYILHFKDINMARHVIRLFPLPSKYNKSAVFD